MRILHMILTMSVVSYNRIVKHKCNVLNCSQKRICAF